MAVSQMNFRFKVYILEIDSVIVPKITDVASAPAIDYVTRIIETFDVCRNDIHYRAEGNANIVIGIQPRCQVLRLSKILKDKRIFYVFKYIDCVSKLFGNISSRPILVRIQFCNLDAFTKWLQICRPIHRIQPNTTTERVGFDFDYGLLYHDACSLNLKTKSSIPWLRSVRDAALLAVEIKPKQGIYIDLSIQFIHQYLQKFNPFFCFKTFHLRMEYLH